MVTKPRPYAVSSPLPEDRLEEEKLRLARVLIETLSPDSRAQLARELSDFPDANTPTGVLAKVLRLVPRGREVTASELMRRVAEHGVEAEPKEVYNSIGYLAKTGALRRLGYGRYVVNGMEISTSDDLGGERDRHEDLSDG